MNHAHMKCINDIAFNLSSLGMVTVGWVKFWQRNRPGDREEVLGNNFANFRSR